MADREASFDLIARDKTAPGAAAAERRLERVKGKAKDTSTAIERAQRRIDGMFSKIRDRADAWDSAGNNAGKRMAGKIVGHLAGIAGAAVGIGGKIAGSIGSGISGAGPYITAAVVGALSVAAVAAAPVIGAAIPAGILLGVGGLVLAAGIKAAASSPAVQAAWKTFGDRAKKAFEGFGKPFEGPAIRAAKTFGDALERMAPSINKVGATLAPIIDKLAPALASMAEKALPGIALAAERSAPIFEALARSLPGLGTSISRFFTTISEHAPEAAQLVEDIIDVLGFLIEHTGRWIAFLTSNYASARQFWIGVGDAIATFVTSALNYLGNFINAAAKAFSWIPGIGPKLAGAAAEFNEFAGKVNAALASIRDRTVTVTARVATVRTAGGVSVGEGNSRPGAGGGAFGGDPGGGWFPGAVARRFAGGQPPDGGGGVDMRSRTGGPVEVKSNVDVNVSLDGRPFRSMVASVVSDAERRSAWRAKVGRR